MQSLDASRTLLLDAVSGADVTFYRSEGNRGDDLIEAGTRALLDGAGIPYRFLFKEDIRQFSGDLLLIGGGGGWCHYWRHSPSVLIDATGFERVVVFPSTFDMTEPLTAFVVQHTTATLFAREMVSAKVATFAHCPAMFYPFRSRRHGAGILHAFRTDHESSGAPVPPDNVDIASISCSLEAWLSLIDHFREVHTDRAHVLIAAAMLGKRVRWRPNGYFKVRAIAETLAGYDVAEL
jgi:hypothetical protein